MWQKTTSCFLVGLAFCFAGTVNFGCAHAASLPTPDKVIMRNGRADTVNTESNDKEMNDAIAKAQASIPTFLKTLQSPKPGQTEFAAKKAFSGGERNEHIWITGLTYDGKMLHGKIANTPDYAPNIKEGDKVSLPPAEITDWNYQENRAFAGRLHDTCALQSAFRRKSRVKCPIFYVTNRI